MQSLKIHPFARRLLACCHALAQPPFIVPSHSTITAMDEGLLWMTPAGEDFRTLAPHHFIVQWPESDRQIIAPNARPHIDYDTHRHYLLHAQTESYLIARLWMPSLQRWAKSLGNDAYFSLSTGQPANASATVIVNPSTPPTVSNGSSPLKRDTVIIQPEEGVWFATRSPEDLPSFVYALQGWFLLQS